MTEFLIKYLEWAAQIAAIWGPVLIFVFMTIESSFIPFPSEVVMIPAGFMAARLELFPGPAIPAAILAVVCGVAGSMTGAYINYYLSSKLGRPVLHRYGKWFFLKPATLDRAEEIFREYGEVTTFVCRLIPAIRQLISIPAGLSRMNFFRFSLFTGLGAGLWVIFLTGIGYYFGHKSGEMTYADLVHQGKDVVHHNLVWIMLGVVVIVGVYAWVHHRVMQSRKTKPPESQA